ncbi:MAG: sulfatase-like hydrolase/transferase [Roseovarius sp.]
MTSQRNILFIVIDQLRADCLTGALADHVDMPHLQALRKEAVTFANHHSVCNPCGPARASLLTGQYAMNHGAVRNGTPLPHDTPNLATELRSAGYVPLLYGYNDSSRDPRGLDPSDPVLTSYEEVMPGFEEVVEMRLEKGEPWRKYLTSKGYDLSNWPNIYDAQGDDVCDPAMYSAEHSDTAFLTDQMLADLAQRPPGWCAHLTYIRPHPPLVAPAPYNRMYDPADLPDPLNVSDRDTAAREHPLHAVAMEYRRAANMVDGFSDLDDSPETTAKLRAIYLGLATEVDHHIGRVVQFLHDTNQYDDTLIVVTADHGEMLGDHHAWGKMSYHHASHAVPLIIRDPHHPAQFGSTITHPTESVDIAPTLLHIAGVLPPDTMDGRNLCGFLQHGTQSEWRDYIYCELDYGNPLKPTLFQQRLNLPCDQANLAILIKDTHTLVHFNGGLPPVLLEAQTGGAVRDISAQPEAASVILELSQMMLSHKMTFAGGRFAHTMITSDGAKTMPRHQNTPERVAQTAKAS